MIGTFYTAKIIGPGGSGLKQLETDTQLLYTTVTTTGGVPKLTVRGSRESIEKAKEIVQQKLRLVQEEEVERKRLKEEERAKKQQEWEEKQKLLALRNRRLRRPPKKQ